MGQAAETGMSGQARCLLPGSDYIPRVDSDATTEALCQKVWAGERITGDEAARLYELPLSQIGALADRRRRLAKADAYDGRGNEIATYNIDRNINYTNVCNVYCKFCAFYRTEKQDDSYVITRAEIDQKIEETIALGGTQILMQGGHHPKLDKQWYLELLSHIRDKFPQINIHAFSPSEFIHFRDVFGESLETLIPRLEPRRWRRDFGRRSPATHLAAQGDERRLAGGDGRGAQARHGLDGDDDVRARRFAWAPD